MCASVRDSYASTTVREGSIRGDVGPQQLSTWNPAHGPGRLRPTCVTGGDVGAVMSMVRALARLRSSLVLRALACLLSLTASTAHPHRSRSTRSPFSTTSQASPSSRSSSGVWSTRVSARARRAHNGESARARRRREAKHATDHSPPVFFSHAGYLVSVDSYMNLQARAYARYACHTLPRSWRARLVVSWYPAYESTDLPPSIVLSSSRSSPLPRSG